ncbi:MAG: CsgG/HfaB family protein, partial [Thermodesulfobacteriota bacterium]
MKRILIHAAPASVIGAVLILMGVCFPAGAKEYVIGVQSRDLLERSGAEDANNYAVAYYLGKVYLAEGNTDAAIDAWERYIALAPEDGKSTAVRERLTVMKLRRAERLAEQATAGKTPEGEIEENTLAVLNFQSPKDNDSAVISKGLTAMIITDLSKVPELKVVERENMQALLQEIRLGQTGLVDEDTAVKAGRLLLARNLVRGTLTPPDAEKIAITSTITETRDGTDLGGPNAEGPVEKLFEMEKDLVFGILDTLGLSMEETTKKAVGSYHTRDMEAFRSYSQGLDFRDQGRFTEAKNAFQNAVELDPGFDLANEALISTPADISAVEGIEGLEMMELEEEDSDGTATGEETAIGLADL